MDFLLFALATPVQFWAGRGFYTSAWSAARHLTSNMNTLIAVGTSVAYTYSTVVTFFGDSWFFDGTCYRYLLRHVHCDHRHRPPRQVHGG